MNFWQSKRALFTLFLVLLKFKKFTKWDKSGEVKFFSQKKTLKCFELFGIYKNPFHTILCVVKIQYIYHTREICWFQIFVHRKIWMLLKFMWSTRTHFTTCIWDFFYLISNQNISWLQVPTDSRNPSNILKFYFPFSRL